MGFFDGANIMSWVDGIQLAQKWLNRSNQPPLAAITEKKEEPLTQQVTSSILPTRDDEAILIALDAAVSKLSDGLNHLARIQQVREKLEPHQQTDWRKNLGSLKMTERFEQAMASETVTESNRGGPDADDQGQPQRRRAGGHNQQRRTERKFERRPIDYEWTDKDPRVQHLLLISSIAVTPNGVEKAQQYLLSAGFIKKQSASQQAAAAAEQGARKTTDLLYSLAAGDEINGVLRAYDDGIDAAVAAKNDVERLRLERERQERIVLESRIKNVEIKSRSHKLTWLWIGLAIVISIAVMWS